MPGKIKALAEETMVCRYIRIILKTQMGGLDLELALTGTSIGQ